MKPQEIDSAYADLRRDACDFTASQSHPHNWGDPKIRERLKERMRELDARREQG